MLTYLPCNWGDGRFAIQVAKRFACRMLADRSGKVLTWGTLEEVYREAARLSRLTLAKYLRRIDPKGELKLSFAKK